MDNPLARDLDHVLEHTEPLWTGARGARIFVTGGTGFVGTWITESLLWANRRLGLDLSAVLLTRNPDAFRRRSPHLDGDAAVTLLTGDAASFAWPAGSFALVIHAATGHSVAPDAEHPTGTFDRDIAAMRRVLDFARAAGVRRLLFTSSGAVYGKQPPELSHVPEDHPERAVPHRHRLRLWRGQTRLRISLRLLFSGVRPRSDRRAPSRSSDRTFRSIPPACRSDRFTYPRARLDKLGNHPSRPAARIPLQLVNRSTLTFRWRCASHLRASRIKEFVHGQALL